MKANQKADRYEQKLLNSVNQPLFKVHMRNFSMSFITAMKAAKTCYPDRDPKEVQESVRNLCLQFIGEWEEEDD